MRLTTKAANHLSCLLAALGAAAAVLVGRWNMQTPFKSVFTGGEGAKTIVAALALGGIASLVLYRLFWRRFPWDDVLTRAEAGTDPSVQPPVDTDDTERKPAPATSTTVRAGAVVSFEAGNGQLGDIQERLDALQSSLKALASKLDEPRKNDVAGGAEPTNKAVEAITAQMEAALKNAREQVERRDQVTERLVATLSKSSIQRTLARFAQTLELARAVAAKVSEGKTTGADAMEFVLGDLESVLADNNVQFLSINPGDKVATLPPGSFTPIAALDAADPAQVGTVKEARTAAYFIDDGEGQRRFIAPAKVVVYKAAN